MIKTINYTHLRFQVHGQNKVEESIQKLLSEMEEVVSQRMNQMFHDVLSFLTGIRLESI